MGGKGQEKLLAASVRVVGLDVTAAYLAAGGTPVLTETTGGFFAGRSVADFNPDAVAPNPDVLAPNPDVVAPNPDVLAPNPDVLAPFIPSGVEGRATAPARTSHGMHGGATIARVPFGFPAEATRAVAVGGDGVVFRDGGCADCFAQSAAALTPAPPSVALEALAALAWQRIVLGLADSIGALRLSGEPGVLRRCEVHR